MAGVLEPWGHQRSEPVIAALTALLGEAPRSWEPRAGGHTLAGKARATLSSGSSVFVKWALGPGSAALRDEIRVLSTVRGSFLPLVVAWSLDPAILVLEDLSSARWPPPYPADCAPLWEALEAKAGVKPPPGLPCLEDWPDSRNRWRRVLEDPEPFLALGVATDRWLASAADDLIAAEDSVRLAGTQLVHNDLFSANVVFSGDRALFVDWATAAVGNAELDAAAAILSLRVDGGPTDHPPLYNEPGFAAMLAGHNALEAPAPLPAWAKPDSTMRSEQLGDLRHALAWASEELGLPVPGRPIP
ncbi:MAG: hypothetical protein QG587_302 [Chloroflexota bacterium]|nr:hypothetical protein [Chloroflexota bacterium]